MVYDGTEATRLHHLEHVPPLRVFELLLVLLGGVNIVWSQFS